MMDVRAGTSALPPLDSGRLHTFRVVARERGFSRAARQLGRTQSSVSQAVAQLERELGAPLFERRGRTAVLTEAGHLLLPHADRILEEMERTRAHLEAARELRAGELVIGTSDTLACHLLPRVLAAFRRRYPGVELRLVNRPSPATAAAVADRQVHVGVVSLPLPPQATDARRVRVTPLCPQTDVLITPPGHPLARGRRVALAALADHPLLLLDRTTGSRAYLDAALAALPRPPRVVMEMSSVEVLKRLVELEFGLSVVPAWSVRRELAARTLAARPLRGLPAGRDVGLVLPALDPLPRATAAFADLTATMLRK
jgi:DNA-binding transcriptional LysR family regulator